MDDTSFYSATPENTLRFGDIIRGYPSVFATIDVGSTPFLQKGISVVVNHQAYGMVLNPCCSIRDEKLSIAVLNPIDKRYLKIPKLKENLLYLNEPMLAKDAIAPEHWLRLLPEEQAARESSGLSYVFNTAFIFAPNALLPEYEIEIVGNKQNFGFYEIDFRECSLIKSKKIKSPDLPVDNIEKILQLSDYTRLRLREKILAYYDRIAE